MKASITWLILLLAVLVNVIVAWQFLDRDWFVSLLPTLGLMLGVFVALMCVVLFVLPENRNSFRVLFALWAATRALRQGEYETADQSLRRALAFAELTGRARDRNLGEVLFHLAELHRLLGRYAESELLYVQALRHLREVTKPNHPVRMYTEHNLGVIYITQGRFAEAEPVCAAALELMVARYGAAHPYPAVARCNLAKCYQGQGRFEAAEASYRQLLEESAGQRRPDERMLHAVCLHNLADLYLEQKRFPEAATRLQEARGGLQMNDLAWRQEAVRLLHTEAELARELGRREEAAAACERFHREAEQAFPPEHPIRADGWLTQARLCAAASKLEEAAVLYQRCWAVWEQGLAPEHTRRARCVEEYAEVLRRLGRATEATQLTARAHASPVWVQAAERT